MRHKIIHDLRSMFALSLFKDARFSALFIAGFVTSLGYLVPFFLLPIYAQHVGIDATRAALLVGILNGSSALGRLAMGVIADAFGRLLILFLSLVASAASCAFLWTFATSFQILIAFAILYGVAIGGFVSLLPVLLADLFGILSSIVFS